MKVTCWILSILLHAGVAAAAAFLATPGTLSVDLDVPVYEVDIVSLEPAKKGPSKPVQKAPAPKPAPAPAPKPAPVKQVAKAPEQPAPKPAPKPEPKPAAKEISAVKKEQPKPEPKPAPKEAKKPEPKPAKPEKSRQQLLAEALKHAEKDVNWLEHLADKEREKEHEAVQQEIAALRESVAEEEAARAQEQAEAEEPGAGGDAEDGGGSAGLLDIYRVVVRDTIKENWRYPDITASGELSARVEIELGADGSIVDYRIIETSGRPDFDSSTLAAVQATGSLPPPPRADLKIIRITFNLQDMLR